MALDDPQAVHSTRPTVEIDGMSYPNISTNIVAVQMEEQIGGLSSLELTVTDWIARADGTAGYGADGGSPLKLGAGLRVFMGAAGIEAGEIFDGQITAIECEWRAAEAPLFTVLAEDRLFSLRRRRRSQLFENRTLSDIVSAIGADHGLTAEVRDGVPGLSLTVAQQKETDLAFLRRLASRFDVDFQVVGARLQVGKIGIDRRSAVTLAAGSTLESVRVTADIADQINTARVASHDPATGEAVKGDAEGRGNGPGSGETGAQILARSFAPVAMPTGHYGPMSQSEADAIAKAEYDRRARAFVQATGTAIGSAQIRVGTWLTLTGINPQFVNEYAVTRCVHRFDNTYGYRTDFDAECAYLGEAA